MPERRTVIITLFVMAGAVLMTARVVQKTYAAVRRRIILLLFLRVLVLAPTS